jgi:TIR domain-containing protein
MEELKNMETAPRLFLSYAREDRGAVEKIYRRLVNEGFVPWMDVYNILPGQRWDAAIRKAIRESDFFLIFLSQHAVNKRGFIQKEIRSALDIASELLDADVFIIPIRLEESEIPEPLSGFHQVDIYKEGAWSSLLQAVNSQSGISIPVSRIRETLEGEGKIELRSHVFVAMSFSKEMEDTYYYGIQRAADANGFACKRIDKESFTGEVLQEMKTGIETASVVIGDLTGANPNVYLEIGYAWGNSIPTILIIKDHHELKFDVRGQRCLIYTSIRNLEELLTKELENLKSKGLI